MSLNLNSEEDVTVDDIQGEEFVKENSSLHEDEDNTPKFCAEVDNIEDAFSKHVDSFRKVLDTMNLTNDVNVQGRVGDFCIVLVGGKRKTIKVVAKITDVGEDNKGLFYLTHAS